MPTRSIEVIDLEDPDWYKKFRLALLGLPTEDPKADEDYRKDKDEERDGDWTR